MIIFDRIFGTFVEEVSYGKVRSRDGNGEIIEGKSEKIAYGLVSNVETFSIFKIHHHYYKHIYDSVICNQHDQKLNFSKKLKIIFSGPGYNLPGNQTKNHRLGSLTDIPEIENPVKYYETKSKNDWRILLYSFGMISLVAKQIDILYFSEVSTLGKWTVVIFNCLFLEWITYFLDDKRPKKFWIIALHVSSSLCNYLVLESPLVFVNLGLLLLALKI